MVMPLFQVWWMLQLDTQLLKFTSPIRWKWMGYLKQISSSEQRKS